MSTKNFDAEIETARAGDPADEDEALQPVPFMLGGREWHLGFIPGRLLVQFVARSRTEQGLAAVLDSILERLVVEEERDDFRAFCMIGFPERSEPEVDDAGEPVLDDDGEPVTKIVQHAFPPPDLDLLKKLVAWAVSVRAKRPTTPAGP